MSGPCLSSSVAGRPLRPATRHSLGGLLPRQLADRPRDHQEAPGCPGFGFAKMSSLTTCGINSPFGELSPTSRQISHVLRTLTPLNFQCIATLKVPFDLHVLSTPPPFVLSQNQTLRRKCCAAAASRSIWPFYDPLREQQVSALTIKIKNLTCNAQFNFCCMDCFEFVSASASTRDASAGDSKPNCQKTCSAFEFSGSQDFACASGSRERLSRASQRALCFSGRDTLFRSSPPSTTFCKFLCSLRL